MTSRRVLAAVAAGAQELPPVERALVGLAVSASTAVLDHEAMRRYAEEARRAGATEEELAEAVVLAAVIGLHSLTDGLPVVDAVLGGPERDATPTAPRGDFWTAFEAELPGVLAAMARTAPEAVAVFHALAGLPWRSGHLPARLKELVYVALDATPGHVHAAGLRLHARQAVRAGATPPEVAEVLLLAARGGEPPAAALAAVAAALDTSAA